MEIAGLEPAPLERPAKLPLTTISPAGRRVHPPFDQAPATFLLALSSCSPSYSGGIGEDDGDRTRKFQLERLVTLPICLRPQIWR